MGNGSISDRRWHTNTTNEKADEITRLWAANRLLNQKIRVLENANESLTLTIGEIVKKL